MSKTISMRHPWITRNARESWKLSILESVTDSTASWEQR